MSSAAVVIESLPADIIFSSAVFEENDEVLS